MGEEWRPVPGFEGRYEVSSKGRVRSLDRYISFMLRGRPTKYWKLGVVLKQRANADGYLKVNLSRGVTFLAHRLVALAFLPNSEGRPEVNHINGDRQDNVVANLEWCTSKENSENALQRGSALFGENAPPKKLSEQQVKSIFCRIKGGESCQSIAVEYGVSRSAIRKIRDRITWVRTTNECL